MSQRRGSSLVSTLMVSAILLLVALTMATTGTSHLQVATRQSNLEVARNLAESVTALAIDKLADDPTFGLGPDPAQRSLTVSFNGRDQGRLTFDSDTANNWTIPLSINNVESDLASAGTGRTLAPFTAQIMAVGESNGVVVTRETILRIPNYKFAIATSGPLTSNGGLYVAAVDALADISGGLASVPPEQIEDGNLAANGVNLVLSSSPAQPSVITGDAQSGGTILLGAQTNVQGSVLENSDPAALPDLDVVDYDPAGWTGLFELTSGTSSGTLTLEGPVRRAGDLTISNGGLELNGAYVYVDGDLVVNGGITGKGAVFCTGDVTISGASALSTDNVQALVAQGDVTINGYDKDSSHFVGVLYNRGDVSISDITLIGSLVNKAPPGSTFDINRTNAIAAPEAVAFDWDFPFEARIDLPTPGLPMTGFTYIRVGGEVDLNALYNPATDSFDPNLVTAENTPMLYHIGSSTMLPGGTNYRETTDFEQAVQWWWEGNANAGSLPIDQVRQQLEVAVDDFLNQFRANLLDLDSLYQKTKDPTLKKGKFTLDPNQFIQFSERVRVVWVREWHR
ncbi:MAG: hypothetical protein KC910_24400 [Candidatus Eremiobacteraeota bacterium]|nr:hypothetical protein [Candidatus Eremiobacteraeota bacterium]